MDKLERISMRIACQVCVKILEVDLSLEVLRRRIFEMKRLEGM